MQTTVAYMMLRVRTQIIGCRMAITIALVSKEIQAFQNFSGYIFTNNKKIQKERLSSIVKYL